jgi:hypothetical protein
LDLDKPLSESDSSLELILSSLSKAFGMKPRQAAALLTNNSQYLIHACVRGVKGGRFDPVLNWYEILIEHAEDISALLEAELQQFPNT